MKILLPNLLLIDIGNSRIKWRHVKNQVWGESDHQGSAFHDQLVQLTNDWRALKFQQVQIANVAGPALLDRLRSILADVASAAEVQVLTPAKTQCGVMNCYEQPERLGADRWASLIAARALHPDKACLIASLGTATTVDLLNDTGQFVGGVILPGLSTMRRSLATQTAQLPLAEGHYVFLADNTEDAIIGGTLHAQAGAIERIWRQAQTQSHTPTPICILTGGNATQVLPLLPFAAKIEECLVLRGLHVIAQA